MDLADNSHPKLSDSDLAKLSKQGDDKAFDELSLRYLSIISFIAHKYSAQGYEQKDFIQEGLIGLLYACRTFDENGAASFKNYMTKVIERRFVSIIRKSNAKKAVPDSALVQIDSLDEKFEDTALTPEELVTMREHLDIVLSRLRYFLSKREYDVVTLYADGLSYSKIADKLSITEKSVDNALCRARKKLCDKNMS
ncbi:MAG: sigma-70 family RNA polymerase sigma factor [Clostridia bacterium]|nr:sigma-70 family RNA polymerase sigma factor [Clostridia bacterium]